MAQFDVTAVCALLEQFAHEVGGDLEAHVDFYSEKRPDGSLTLVAKPKTQQGSELIARMKALDPTEH